MSTSQPVTLSRLSSNLRRKKIVYLGPKATGLISAFRLFHATVLQFEDGCKSLRDVSQRLEANQGDLPEDSSIPVSVSSVQRACARTEEFFLQHWESENRPELFRRTGHGKSFSGVTQLGKDAWALVHEYLCKLGVIQNESLTDRQDGSKDATT